MANQKTYVVRVTRFHSIKVKASTPTQAKYKAWNQIKDGYTYGFRNRKAFVKGTTVE